MTTHRKKKRLLVLLGIGVAALAPAASAQAAYLQLGTSNTSNSTTLLKGGTDGPELHIINTHANRAGIKAEGGSFGLYGQSSSTNSTGVRGVSNTGPYASGVSGTTSTGAGVYGFSSGGTGQGVSGQSTALNGTGVIGTANNGGSARGVFGFSQGGSGVFGFGLQYGGSFLGTTGVQGVSSALNSAGVKGVANSGVVAHGVEGRSSSGTGVFGESTALSGNGVFGVANNGTGVRGSSASGYGVAGFSTNGFGVYGESGKVAGQFIGNVVVSGTLSKTAGNFRIDDPIDPGHKYLQHSFVESPDMMDVYNGNVTTDGRGFATVAMPHWFQALNRSFRYQLTILGHAPWDTQARIWNEIRNNRFTMRTNRPRVKVSWQVTGIRHDPYANAHRIQVVVPKSKGEQGKYLRPELYGKSQRLTIGYLKPSSLRSKPAWKR
jgi:hypothetical protein